MLILWFIEQVGLVDSLMLAASFVLGKLGQLRKYYPKLGF